MEFGSFGSGHWLEGGHVFGSFGSGVGAGTMMVVGDPRAVLPRMMQLLIVGAPSLQYRPPPCSAVLPRMMLSVTLISAPLPYQYRPPPKAAALPVNWLFRTRIVPPLKHSWALSSKMPPA